MARSRMFWMGLAAVLSAPLACLAQTDAEAKAIRKLLVDASDAGPATGTATPEFRLKDQNGRDRDRKSLSGPHGEEVHRQYLLSFEPKGSEPGAFHTIRVAVKDRPELRVKTRQGYWALK